MFEIVNSIKGVESLRYLELGVLNKKTFKQVKCGYKKCVDLNNDADYIMSTDNFFNTYPFDFKFDIIFIDASHKWENVFLDLNNALKRCSKFIFIHDLIPPRKSYCDSGRCGDGFKLLYFLLDIPNLKLYPSDSDMGLTLITCPFPNEIDLDHKKANAITYDIFIEKLKNYKIHTGEELSKICNDNIQE